MNQRDALVAISNWDPELPATKDLPRVGDYRTVDWEKLAQVKPQVLIVQFRSDKMPPGLVDRAHEMGMDVVNVKINTLSEVFATLEQLGKVAHAENAASDAIRSLHGQLDEVQKRVNGRPPVRTLIVRDDNPLDVVGGGNFMDELLTIAGGKNVIEGGDNYYPTIDKEQLAQLNPDAVIQVLPGASAQVVQKAKEAWATMPPIGATQHARVSVLTQDYLLLPGYSVGKIAWDFGARLHPDAFQVPDRVPPR